MEESKSWDSLGTSVFAVSASNRVSQRIIVPLHFCFPNLFQIPLLTNFNPEPYGKEDSGSENFNLIKLSIEQSSTDYQLGIHTHFFYSLPNKDNRKECFHLT